MFSKDTIRMARNIVVWISIFAFILLVCYLIYRVQIGKTLQETDKNDYLLPEKTYRQPIVNLPFMKNKQPVKDKNLPIVKSKINKSIEIVVKKPTDDVKNTAPRPVKVTLIVDKKGKIYKAKDTPENMVIKVTKWKEKFMDFDFGLGYSLIYKGEFYHCLSAYFLRIWKISFALDAGISTKKIYVNDFLLGLSGKYHFATLSTFKKDIKLSLTLGFDLSKDVYGGLSIKF